MLARLWQNQCPTASGEPDAVHGPVPIKATIAAAVAEREHVRSLELVAQP
jgi:hypothetical protein